MSGVDGWMMDVGQKSDQLAISFSNFLVNNTHFNEFKIIEISLK